MIIELKVLPSRVSGVVLSLITVLCMAGWRVEQTRIFNAMCADHKKWDYREPFPLMDRDTLIMLTVLFLLFSGPYLLVCSRILKVYWFIESAILLSLLEVQNLRL